MSTYLKAKEDGRRKREKTREELRIKFAGDALIGYISRNFEGDEYQLAKACMATADAMVRALGYGYEVTPSPLSDEEKVALVEDDEV